MDGVRSRRLAAGVHEKVTAPATNGHNALLLSGLRLAPIESLDRIGGSPDAAPDGAGSL